jgi:hypothetical protein
VAVFFVIARAGVLFLVVLRAGLLAGFAALLVADRALDFEACFAAGFLVAAFAAGALVDLAARGLAPCCVLAVPFALAVVADFGLALAFLPRGDVFLLVLLFAMILVFPTHQARLARVGAF